MITTGLHRPGPGPGQRWPWHIFAVYWLGSVLGRLGANGRLRRGTAMQAVRAVWAGTVLLRAGRRLAARARGSARRCRTRPSVCARRIHRTTAGRAATGRATGAIRQPRAGRPVPHTGSERRRCGLADEHGLARTRRLPTAIGRDRARFNAQEIASTLTGRRSSDVPPHRGPPGLLSQFLSHSPLSGAVHQRPPRSCSGRSRTVTDLGERWPALLESVLGATPQEFASPILRRPDLRRHVLIMFAGCATSPSVSYFLSQLSPGSFALFRTDRCGGTLR